MSRVLTELNRVIALVGEEAARPMSMRSTEASDAGLAAAISDLGAIAEWVEKGAVEPLPDELDNLFYFVIDEWSPTSPVTDATLRTAFLVQKTTQRRRSPSRDIPPR